MTANLIDTAPLDANRLLVFGEHSLDQEFDPADCKREWHIAWWSDGCWVHDGEGYVNGVTHWLPIPPSP